MLERSKIDIIMVVDCSGTLKHVKKDMQDAINDAIVAIKKDKTFYNCDVYLSLIAFDEIIREETFRFRPIKEITKPIEFGAFEYSTNPGPALSEITVDAIRRYEKWVKNGDECFHPVLFFFTDGKPNHVNKAKSKKFEEDYKKAAQYIKEKEAAKKMLVVSCAFGENADIPNIQMMTKHNNRILKVKTSGETDRLKQFFKDIIPVTVNRTVTMTGDQLDEFFNAYNGQE